MVRLADAQALVVGLDFAPLKKRSHSGRMGEGASVPTLRIRAVSLLAASFEDTLKMECDANLFLTPLAVRSALFALQNTLGPGDGSRLIGPVEDFRHLEGRIESIEKRKATVIGRAWPLEAGEVVFLKGKT